MMKKYLKQVSWLFATTLLVVACAEKNKESSESSQDPVGSALTTKDITIDTTGGFTPKSGVKSEEHLLTLIKDKPQCQRPSNQKIRAALAHGCLLYQASYLYPNNLPSNLENLSTIQDYVKKLKSKGDRYTYLIPPNENLSTISRLDRASIGFVVKYKNKNDRIPASGIVIHGIKFFSNAWFHDLRPGDRIQSINGIPIIGKTYKEALKLISKKEGTDHTLVIHRRFDRVFVRILTRKIKSQNYFNFKVNDRGQKDPNGGYGYIRIRSFGTRAGTALVQYAENFKKDGIDQLIVDLRGNSGGSLLASTIMADYLVPASDNGKNSYTLVDKNKKNTKVSLGLNLGTTHNVAATKNNKKLVILVDQNSASASEMVAGVTKAYSSATIIGRTTFGKGVGQTNFYLVNRSILAVTSFKIFLAGSSESYHEKGIVPNYAVSHRMTPPKMGPKHDNQLKQAALFLKNGIIAPDQLFDETASLPFDDKIASMPDQLEDIPTPEPVIDPLQKLFDDSIY